MKLRNIKRHLESLSLSDKLTLPFEVLLSLTNHFVASDEFDGVCHGFTLMWLQASLTSIEAEKQFFRRLYFIQSLYQQYGEERLIDEIKKLVKKSRIYICEKLHLPMLSTLQDILEIKIFFELLALMQEPGILTFRNKLRLEAKSETSQSAFLSLIPSKQREEQMDGQSVPFYDSLIGIYAFTKDALNCFLVLLAEKIKQNPAYPSRFYVCNNFHTVGLQYDPATNSWRLIDSVNLSLHNQWMESGALSTELIDALEDESITVFSIHAWSQNKNQVFEDDMRAYYHFWKHSTITQDERLLYVGCREGDVELVKRMLTLCQIDVNKPDNDDLTPLFLACSEGHVEIVKLLLEQTGINVNQADGNGVTPLLIACQEGHVAVVANLLNHPEIDVFRTDKYSMTPIEIAYQEGYEQIVDLLSEQCLHITRKHKLVLPAYELARETEINSNMALTSTISRISRPA